MKPIPNPPAATASPSSPSPRLGFFATHQTAVHPTDAPDRPLSRTSTAPRPDRVPSVSRRSHVHSRFSAEMQRDGSTPLNGATGPQPSWPERSALPLAGTTFVPGAPGAGDDPSSSSSSSAAAMAAAAVVFGAQSKGYGQGLLARNEAAHPLAPPSPSAASPSAQISAGRRGVTQRSSSNVSSAGSAGLGGLIRKIRTRLSNSGTGLKSPGPGPS